MVMIISYLQRIAKVNAYHELHLLPLRILQVFSYPLHFCTSEIKDQGLFLMTHVALVTELGTWAMCFMLC